MAFRRTRRTRGGALCVEWLSPRLVGRRATGGGVLPRRTPKVRAFAPALPRPGRGVLQADRDHHRRPAQRSYEGVCLRLPWSGLCLPVAEFAAPSRGGRATEGSSGRFRSSPAKAAAPPRAISASISTVQPTSTRTVRPAPPSHPVRNVQGMRSSCECSC